MRDAAIHCWTNCPEWLLQVPAFFTVGKVNTPKNGALSIFHWGILSRYSKEMLQVLTFRYSPPSGSGLLKE